MLRASDVVRTASMQITVGIGFLVELDQSFILKHPVYKVVVFLLRACTPFDTVRSREARTRFNPSIQRAVACHRGLLLCFTRGGIRCGGRSFRFLISRIERGWRRSVLRHLPECWEWGQDRTSGSTRTLPCSTCSNMMDRPRSGCCDLRDRNRSTGNSR